MAGVEGSDRRMTSDFERKVARDLGFVVEYQPEGMLDETRLGYLLRSWGEEESYLPSGSPVPGKMYPSCGFFVPDVFAARIFAPNAAASRAASRPMCPYPRMPTVFPRSSSMNRLCPSAISLSLAHRC